MAKQKLNNLNFEQLRVTLGYINMILWVTLGNISWSLSDEPSGAEPTQDAFLSPPPDSPSLVVFSAYNLSASINRLLLLILSLFMKLITANSVSERRCLAMYNVKTLSGKKMTARKYRHYIAGKFDPCGAYRYRPKCPVFLIWFYLNNF